MSYFSNWFSTNYEHRPMDFLSALERRVIDNMCLELDSDFLAEEINIILKQMHPTKAPGLDGMSFLFDQKYWHIVGPIVTKVDLHSFN